MKSEIASLELNGTTAKSYITFTTDGGNEVNVCSSVLLARIKENSINPISVHETQDDAIKAGEIIAKDQEVKLAIHGENGTCQRKQFDANGAVIGVHHFHQ